MISATNTAALESSSARDIYFLFLNFAGDPFRACTGTRNYAWGGESWLGIGEIAGISDIAEASDTAARPLTVTLSGVDSYVTEVVMARANYKGRVAILYRGLLDSNGDLLDAPFTAWRGRMDVGAIAEGDDKVAQMICEPLSARLLRPNLSRYSDQDHQLRHPGDKFYEFLPQMENKQVIWGGARVNPSRGPAQRGQSNERAIFRQQ